MKKIVSLFLAILMLLSLCACSSSLATEEEKDTVEETKTEVKKEEEETGPIVYPEGFSAGFGRQDITPDVFPADLGSGVMATRVADPLYASCTALCDGENVALIYHLDLKSIPFSFFETITKRLNKNLGIPAENVILNATHSHNSPESVPGSDTFGVRWSQKLIPGILKAGELALRDLAPAEIYTSKGDTTNFAFVRRYLMADGSWDGIQMNNPCNDFAEHESEADAELRVIRFDRGEEKDILLVNWQGHAAHGRGLHPDVISSDFIYELRTGVEKEMNVHMAYQNGSSGNLNFTDYLGQQKFENFHEVGKGLVEVVKNAVKTEEKVNPGKVKAATTTVTCTVFVDDAKKVEGAKKYANSTDPAQQNLILAEYGLIGSYEVSNINSRQRRLEKGPTADIALYAISCGDIAFFTSPFEQFDSDGKYVRDNSPFKMTFSCAYSNGHNGYLPSTFAYPHGCYEVYSTPFVMGTSDDLNAGSLSLLNQLYQ